MVVYGTSRDRMDMSSDLQYSGPNIYRGRRTYSLQLNGLGAGTLYQYWLVITNSHQTLSVAGNFTTELLGICCSHKVYVVLIRFKF